MKVKASMFCRASLRRKAFARSHATSTSTSKWPALQQMAPSFILSSSRAVITSLQPVAVMKRSPIGAASNICITRKPSIEASRALTGSTSVTMTRAPSPLARIAMPLPHRP